MASILEKIIKGDIMNDYSFIVYKISELSIFCLDNGGLFDLNQRASYEVGHSYCPKN